MRLDIAIDEKRKREGKKKEIRLIFLVGLAAAAATVLSLILFVVYFGAWLCLGFGIGLYFYFMTWLSTVRVSTSAASSLFQTGLIFIPGLCKILSLCDSWKDSIAGRAIEMIVANPLPDSRLQRVKLAQQPTAGNALSKSPSSAAMPSEQSLAVNPMSGGASC